LGAARKYASEHQKLARRCFGAAGSYPLVIWREPASRGWQFKSTGSFDGFLFSIPCQAKGLGQVQGSVVQRQAMDNIPKIKRIALRTAISLEASECVLAEMDRKRPLLILRIAVHTEQAGLLGLSRAESVPNSPIRWSYPANGYLAAQNRYT
jgi:hypothetical protein